MILAVDFDMTLSLAHYPHIGEPNTPLFEYLIGKREEGHTIILWTCREGPELDAAVRFCVSQGLEFDYVNENVPWLGYDCRKVVADMYIDDLAVNALELSAEL